ncbi:MAG: hypothetical protein ABIU05_17885 [Nitrospirales bacterium]
MAKVIGDKRGKVCRKHHLLEQISMPPFIRFRDQSALSPREEPVRFRYIIRNRFSLHKVHKVCELRRKPLAHIDIPPFVGFRIFDAPQTHRAFNTNRLRAQINVAHMHAVGFFRSYSRLHA